MTTTESVLCRGLVRDITFVAVRGAARRLVNGNPPDVVRRVFPVYV